jgi:hypothetical protein
MNPKPVKDLEWFERKIGTWLGVLSVIMLPVPFVGFFSLLQLLLFIIVGFVGANVFGMEGEMGINEVNDLVGEISFILILITITFALLNIWGMIAWGNAKKPLAWARLFLYAIAISVDYWFIMLVLK